MKNTSSPDTPAQRSSKENQDINLWERNAFRATLVVVAGLLGSALFFIYLSFELRAWQIIFSATVTALQVLVSVGGLWLIRKKRTGLSLALTIGGVLLVIPLITAVIKGVGVSVGIAEAAGIIMLIGLTLRGKLATRAILFTILSSIVSVLFGLYTLPWQLGVPILLTFLPVTAGVLSIILAVFIGQQFRDYSLRAKLIIAFVTVAVMSVFVIASFTTQISRSDLIRERGNTLNIVAQTASLNVGSKIVEQVDLMRTLSSNTIIVEQVEQANATYLNATEATISANIEQLDQDWRAADAADNNSDPLVQNVLSNVSIIELIAFKEHSPDHVEIFVTDKYGANIVATNRTSDYYQADEAWWQAAYNNGEGNPFIGQPEFDDSSRSYAFIMAVPIISPQTGEVIGILRSTYQIKGLVQFLSSARFGITGDADLLFPNGEIIRSNGDLVTLDSETLNQLAPTAESFGQFSYAGVLSIVSQSTVKSSDPEAGQVVEGLDWTLVVDQDLAEALSPLSQTTRTITLIGIGVSLVTGFMAVFATQYLTNSVIRLTAVAEQISAGDLTTNAQVESRDEIGQLASAFNTMTAQLRNLIGTLEDRVRQRTQALAASAEVSRRLSTILDPDQLVLEVVEQVRAAYNYYHVQIYLLDDTGRTMRMVGGTGTTGKTLLAQGHSVSIESGLVARAARTKTGILVPDTSQEPGWLPNPLLPETKAEIVVPIILGEKVIGVMDVQDDVINEMFPEDVELLQSIANQVAIALQNARQYEETQVLFKASQALAATNNYQEMLDAFMTYAAPQSDQGGLLVFSLSDQGELIAADYAASWSRLSDQVQPVEIGTRFAPEQIPFIPLLVEGQPVIVADTHATIPGPQTAAPEVAEVFAQFGVRSVAGFPLILSGKLLGALLFGYTHPHTFTEDELQPVQTIASQMAILIQNQQLFAETQATLAQLDVINRRLTGEGWREFTKLSGGLIVEDIAPGLPFTVVEQAIQDSKNGHSANSTEITVPITVRGEPIGVFSLQQSDEGTAFSNEHLELLQEVADEVAVALENIRLLEETQQNAVALEESRNLLDSVVENLPVHLFVKEAKELRYVRWNKAGEDILGVSASEVVGKTVYDAFEKETADRSTAQDWEVLSRQNSLDIEEEIIETPHRGMRIMHTRKTPVFGPDGQPKYLVGLSEDITERKQAEKALQDLEALYRRAIAAADAVPYSRQYEGETFTFVGEGIEALTGYSAMEFTAQLFDSIILESIVHSSDLPSHSEAVQMARTGKVSQWRADYRVRTRNGRERWLGDTSVEVLGSDGASAGSVGILTDITEQKKNEAALSRQLIEMESLNELGRILTSYTDLDEMLVLAGKKICETFKVDTGYIALYDTRSEFFRIPFSLHVGEQMEIEPQRLGVGLAPRVIRTRQPLFIPEMTEELSKELGAFIVGGLNSVSWLGVPIMSGDEVIGVVSVQHNEQPNWFQESDIQYMTTIASNLSTAIQNIRFFEQTQATLAEMDNLTRRLTREGWQNYVDTLAEEQGYTFDLNRIEPITVGLSSSGKAGVEQPLIIQGETIGRLMVSETEETNQKMTEIVSAVSQQLSAHIENLRLTEQTQQRAIELQQATQFLETIVENLPVGLFMKNATDLRFVRWNPANEALIGLKKEEVIGKSDYDFFSKDVAEYFINKDREVLAGRELVDIPEELIETRSGIRYLHTRKVPVLGSDGNPLYLLGISEDITERKQIQETLAKRATELATVAEVGTASATILNPDELLQTVVDLTKSSFGLYHAHIYLLNEAGDTLVLSNGAGEIGYEMVMKGWQIPLDREKSLVARAARTRAGVIATDVETDPAFLPNPLLPKTRAELAVPLIAGDKVLGILDVQAENVNYFTEEDARIYITLASQIAVALQNARLYVEQAATVQRLRELDHLKSSFLANMSHELRTPLNSIIGFTEIILEEIDGPLTEFMEGDLKIIQKNGKHLLSLINDVLDMAKIEAGRMNLTYERFTVSELLEDVVDITSSLAHDKKLYLKIEGEDINQIELVADRIRLRQVLINVVGNAVKFTQTGGVTLHSEKKDGKLWLKVIDTGMGILPDKLEAIFDHFSQVDTSTTRKAGGTGLGLPISRRLVELHNGQLWAESNGGEGNGSSFFMVLPLEHTPPQQT